MKKGYIFLILCFSVNFIGSSHLNMLSYLQIDFDTSMLHLERYNLPHALKDKDWIQVRKLYENNIYDIEYSEEPRIPKIIHQIWLGSDFPSKYEAYQKSWIKNHPNWEYKLWTDKDISRLNMKNQRLYNSAKNYGEKSDIVRYEVLYQFGGLYVDTDFECLKPFDILHHICDFYAGIVANPQVVTFNGLIAAKARHPILKKCLVDLQKNAQNHNNSLEKTGPFFFTRCILSELDKENIEKSVLFPAPYFYPWPWYKLNDHINRQKYIKPESFAIHHWESSWMKKKLSSKK